LSDTTTGGEADTSPPSSGDPVFAEPWQARAFALTLKLTEGGHFSRKEWSAALSQALRDPTATCGAIDDGTHYYEHWLTALETLARQKGLTDEVALSARKEAWRDAYHRTPHGKPVTLEPLSSDCVATDRPSRPPDTNDIHSPR
jgi:nitrile hydratase accessory protein